MTTQDKPIEQAVIIYFNYKTESLDALHNLSDLLDQHLSEQNIGEFDGHDISKDLTDGALYMYGPSAEALFISIRPILKEVDFMTGAKAKLRFGPPERGVKEIIVDL